MESNEQNVPLTADDHPAAPKEESLVRRALLEEHASVPDAKDEFRKFKQTVGVEPAVGSDEIRHASKHVGIKWFTILAAAACLAFAFLMILGKGDENDDVASSSNGHEVYVAKENSVGDVTLESSKNSINYHVNATDNPLVSQVTYEIVDLDDYVASSATLSVAQGKVVTMTLPDGSHVWLNACSRLVYPERFSKSGPRIVRLEGEAYFQVAKDQERPFVVDCGGLRTKVLGTEFNVRNFADEPMNITLVTGSVVVSVDQSTSYSNKDTVLQPGQQFTLDHSKSSLKEVETELYTVWREGLFYFENQTLREVMIEIGRWYNMNVVFEDLRYLDDRLHFNGDRSWSVEQIIKELQYIAQCKFRIEGNGIVVY